MVTTDKVYANAEPGRPFTEDDRLGGKTPTALKAAAELVTASWRHSYFGQRGVRRSATARAGNVIGGGD